MDYINTILEQLVKLTGAQSEGITLLLKTSFIITSAIIVLMVIWFIFSIIEGNVGKKHNIKKV